MSIIIRLQNLPWAANSVDIRRYFSGLSIPEGGVHIVGGEKGDAFIAFSTDEDARQAMERDGGKIKDMKVKLLLSSRTEMTRVIEQARSQTLSLTPSVVKAAATDSDRRKVRERSPSPARSRKDREKSPPRDRRKSSYSKRERSRSRSPSRRVDRDRDTDRRGDRGKRDDRSRYDERGDGRYKSNSREYNARDSSSQDRKVESGNKVQQEANQSKAFDIRMGATPQTFDSRPHDGGGSRTGSMEFNPRQGNLPDGSASFLASRNESGSGGSSFTFPAALNMAPVKLEPKPEPLQPPAFSALGKFSALFDDQQPAEARTSGSYETKRPSPTPAALAPKVESTSSYAKGYNIAARADPYNSVSGNFGNCPDITAPTYGKVQTAEKGAVPAVPHDRKNVPANKPVYGAEPHARYEQIPEANQAIRSSTAPIPTDDSSLFSKRLSAAPATATSNVNTASKPPRRSRFDPEIPVSQENPYPVPTNDARSSSGIYSSRSVDTNLRAQQHSENSNVSSRDSSLGRKDTWRGPPPGNNAPRPALLTPPQRPDEFSQTVPMDIDDDTNNMSSSRMGGYPMSREGVHDNRSQHSRGYFQNTSDHQKESPFDESPVTRAREPPPINESRHGPPLKRGDEHPARGEERGPPHQRNHPSLTVEVGNLPYDASENDVLELFRGIFVAPENLKLVRNNRGQPNGCAVVKFLKPRDYEEALSRSRQKGIGGVLLEVRPCSLALFENTPISNPPSNMEKAGPGPPQVLPRQNNRPREEFCVELKGLPLSSTEDDIVHFFDGLRILDIVILENPDNQVTTLSFVEFGTSNDFHAALSSTGKMIGRKYITVVRSSKEMMVKAQKERRNRKEHRFPQPTPRDQLPPPSRAQNKGPRPGPQEGPMFCVALNGLPKIVKNRDIADFFAEDKIIPRAIHIMLDAEQLPSGEAFAEFTSLPEFEIALHKSGRYLAGSRISVRPIPHQEMTDILQGPPTAPPPLLRSPRDDDRPPRRPLMPMPPPREEEMPLMGRRPLDDMPPDNFGPARHRLDPRFPPNGRPMYKHSEPPMGGPRPPFRMRGPTPPRSGSRPSRPPLFNADGPPPPSSRGPPRFRPNGPPGMPPGEGPQDFGVPGCVVAISNLHFHAGLDEIMEAFRDFLVDKDKIIRKYNEKGQPTGEARIAFRCHEDAIRAIEEVNQKPIFGRPIFLALVC